MLVNKFFIADTTELWTLITMYFKMSLQLTLQARSFFTHITQTWTQAFQ